MKNKLNLIKTTHFGKINKNMLIFLIGMLKFDYNCLYRRNKLSKNGRA